MKAPNPHRLEGGLYYLERVYGKNVVIIFLGTNTLWALLFAAQRSKDPNTQVGGSRQQ